MDTEHLLLGLLRDPTNRATEALDQLRVRPAKIRMRVEEQVSPESRVDQDDMSLTPSAKQVINLAYDESRTLQSACIGSEHLLLGLLRENEGLAARVLAELGVELDALRNAARQVGLDDEKEHNV